MKKIVWLLVFALTFSLFAVIASASPALIAPMNEEQYQEFVQNGDLPERFVPYERWADFGAFSGYYVEHASCEDEYFLRASDTFRLDIVRYLAEEAFVSGEAMTTVPENLLYLRSATAEEKREVSHICRSGVYYVFGWRKAEDGTYFQSLTSVRWIEGGNFFVLEFPSGEGVTTLEEYLEGVDKNHPLRTLLSPDATDHDVMVALGILEPDPPLFETWEIVTIAVGGAVVLAGVVTLVVLLIPKKKKSVEE